MRSAYLPQDASVSRKNASMYTGWAFYVAFSKRFAFFFFIEAAVKCSYYLSIGLFGHVMINMLCHLFEFELPVIDDVIDNASK